MYSIIIGVINIIVIVALIAATMYFGGGYTKDGKEKADQAAIVSAGAQIAGALEIYKAEHGEFPSGTSDDVKQVLLEQNYLTGVPDLEWKFETDFVVKENLNNVNCLEINKKFGIDGIPKCSDESYANKTVCCAL